MLSDKIKMATLSVMLTVFLAYSLYLYLFLPHQANENAAVTEGKLLWQKHNCNACHQVYGLGGYLGPDLTNVHSARGPEYIRAFLKGGTATMPNFNLTEEEITYLTVYLKDIDASGSSDPRQFKTLPDGTIGEP
jgi:nitric oxide reductase subunit C